MHKNMSLKKPCIVHTKNEESFVNEYKENVRLCSTVGLSHASDLGKECAMGRGQEFQQTKQMNLFIVFSD